MRWFRFYDEVLDDPKVQRLPPDLFKTWVNLLCVASKEGGEIPSNPTDLAFRLRMVEAKMRSQIQTLIEAGLIDQVSEPNCSMKPHNWDGRQYESDSSAERMRRHRQRKRDVTVTSHVTNGDGAESEQSRTDTDTESEQTRPEAVQKILGETSARLRSPRTQPGPDFNDPAVRKAAWEQRAFKAVRASLPDPEATALIAGYIDGDRSAVSRVNAIERTAKNGAHC